jgi:hypothetical protein
MENENKIKVNSVVQVNEKGHEGWIGCLLQVTEIKSNGIMGYVQLPMQGSAFIIMRFEQVDYIGEAVMTKENQNNDNGL